MNFESELRAELGKLPQGLADIYFKIYQQILDPESLNWIIAERSLSWILCCQRKFFVDEFLAAIFIGFAETYIEVTKKNVLNICKNIVIYDSELDIFRFAHLSVRDFLEKNMYDKAHVFAAQTCLVVCLDKRLSLFEIVGFQRYAIYYWALHCDKAGDHRSEGKLGELFREFIQCDVGESAPYEKWDRLAETVLRKDDGNSGFYSIPYSIRRYSNTIFAACVWNLLEILHSLLRFKSKSKIQSAWRYLKSGTKFLDKVTIGDETCLHVAIKYEHLNIVQFLNTTLTI